MASGEPAARIPPMAAQQTKPFAFRPKPFLVFLGVMVVVVAVIAALVAAVVHLPFLSTYGWALLGFGAAYLGASLLSWTGFGNFFRYSPMLLAGSPSYREHVMRGDMYWEGRDNRSLAVGLLFGLALVALGALALLAASFLPSL